MPGRTPKEAFDAFIEPIQKVVACLGIAKLTPSPGGRTEPGQVHAWTLNGERGMAFSGGWHFEAQMHYSFVQGAVSGEWRVQTHGYRYRLALQGTHLWRIHWHPSLTSTYHMPHVHLNLAQPGEVPHATMDQHHPTGRMSLEDAVEWVFNNQSIAPARDDWRAVLEETRSQHVRYRTWHDRPPVTTA